MWILHAFGFTSAVAAHHGPAPAFQTIKLDRVCLGSILKGSRHSGDGQKACFQGFQKCTIFAQQTGPRTKSFRGNFHPLFCFYGYGLTLNLSENKRIGEIRTKTCISTPIPPFWQEIGKWHKSSPPLSPVTPNSLIFMQKRYIYV